VADDVAIADFPATRDAAREFYANGLTVMRIARNLIRGGSHCRNVAAETLAREGVLDILSSDAVPARLLMPAFDLVRVRMTGGVLVVRQVWREGRRVA